MDLNIKGRRALVLGGNRGMGLTAHKTVTMFCVTSTLRMNRYGGG